MELSFKWNQPQSKIAYERTGGDRSRLFLANKAKRLMDPYVPARNLVLAQNVRTYVENGTGYIHYQSPYAHYQYEGEIYGPNIPIRDRNGEVERWISPPHKTATGRKLAYSKFRHPLATDHWDKAMLKDRKEDLAGSYQRWLENKNRRTGME